MELKETSQVVGQMVLRKCGMFASSSLADDLYYLLEAVNLLRKDVGDDILKEHYGNEWDNVQRKLIRLQILVNGAKIFYDALEDKVFKKSKKEKAIREAFIKYLSQIPLVQDILFDVFIVLVSKTQLQRRQIPSEAFKVLEHKSFRKIDMSGRLKPKEPDTKEETSDNAI